MRKTLLAAGLSLFVSAAAFAASDESTPEARAYFSYSFGGSQTQANDLRYGLQLDHDRRFANRPAAPIFQLDFSNGGQARLNGLALTQPRYRVYQNEQGEEEEGGFFRSIGNFFANLFGPDEDEGETAEAEGGGDQAAAEQEDNTVFMNFEAIDLVLLGVTAVGLGYLATEVIDGRERDIPQEGEGPEEPPPCEPGPAPLCSPVPLPLPLQSSAGGLFAGDARLAQEYREWLDGGTGQMGDLE